MRLATLLPLCGLLLIAPAAADTVQSLHGTWQGEEMHLALDPERGQARIDPAKPFQWERFIVKSVAGNEVVFTIGPRLFAAILEGDSLVVEAAGYSGPQRLSRIVADAAAGAPAAAPADFGQLELRGAMPADTAAPAPDGRPAE